MDSITLRKLYLNFFKDRGHAIIPGASLIPENDPTVLFTTAGMHPLVPYLSGEKHPQGTRLTDVQKCVRTGDIDEVGDATHCTFFEMLGNWSLGDYFKKEAISWSFEFLTEVLGIDKNRLAVSVFAGDETAPRDEEAAAIFSSLGGYENSREFLEQCRAVNTERQYQDAAALMAAGEYPESIAVFQKLDGYRDSAEQIKA